MNSEVTVVDKPRKKPPRIGRKPGSRNKNVILKELMETLQSQGFDPLVEMITCYQHAMGDYKQKKKEMRVRGALTALGIASRIAAEMCQYVYPKRKAIEHSGPGGGSIAVTFAALMAQAAEDDEQEKKQSTQAEPIDVSPSVKKD